ncbi:Putative tetratricopeptide-like helical domain superfamily [Septoria linicola]|uniref:Tetratricopeptide-like helical domain superfamily n=1 Tax=Septoria linicola TaxID=215465 RepID=A0A9Q9AV25_9PEZI|nr:putative tetratricopeptide-like helical domain superfamily [Septoria linicola]USW52648.1 Putative tetratricopeptide-like helical domain superfamily [Septoria linicola]
MSIDLAWPEGRRGHTRASSQSTGRPSPSLHTGDTAQMMESTEALPRTHLLSLPAEIREEIYRILLGPAASRRYHDDEYTSYNYWPALQVLRTNRQIYLEARKIFRDLNVFACIETPWPEAQSHVSIEGHVPIIVADERAGKFNGHRLNITIDAPEHSSLNWETQRFVILADDIAKFTEMWMYSSLTHPGLNEHLRLKLELRDPYTPDGEEKTMPKALQRKLLLPFAMVKSLNRASNSEGTIITGSPKPYSSVEQELRKLQAEPHKSPEHCLREATRLKFEGNAELAKGDCQAALRLYNDAWRAMHIVIKGKKRRIHGDAWFARELYEEPFRGKNGQTERLLLRVHLVANTCAVYLKLKEWELTRYWGMRSISMLREAMGTDDRQLLAPEEEAVTAFPAAAQMGKIYYRTAVANKELGDEGEARRLLRVARIYLPDDEAVKREVAATALQLGGPAPYPWSPTP